MSLLQTESGMGCPDWHTVMHSLRLQRPMWIYCLRHTRVSENEWADRLASTADITSGQQFGRAEVLPGLRDFLNMDRSKHHSNDDPNERGVETGSVQKSTLRGWERSVHCVQRDKYWRCFEGNLVETAVRRGGARMGLNERFDTILS